MDYSFIFEVHMSSRLTSFLKHYPAIILLLLSILTLGLFTDGSELGATFEKVMKLYSIVVFAVVPVVCIAISVYVRKKVKLNNCSSHELVANCKEIKQAHKDVYVAFVLLGVICAITVYPIMVTFLIMFVVWSMQFQTGYIGKLGMEAMCEEGLVDKQTYNKYLRSRYIIFKDIKVFQNIVDDKIKGTD